MPNLNTIKPDQGATKSVEARVLSIKFGDGYAQEAADGINNLVETWTVSYTNRTRSEVQSIDDVLKGCAGYLPIDWTTPEGLAKKFTCKRWSPSYNHDGDCSLSATLVQYFGP